MAKVEIYMPPPETRGTVGEYIDHVIKLVRSGAPASAEIHAWVARIDEARRAGLEEAAGICADYRDEIGRDSDAACAAVDIKHRIWERARIGQEPTT